MPMVMLHYSPNVGGGAETYYIPLCHPVHTPMIVIIIIVVMIVIIIILIIVIIVIRVIYNSNNSTNYISNCIKNNTNCNKI